MHHFPAASALAVFFLLSGLSGLSALAAGTSPASTAAAAPAQDKDADRPPPFMTPRPAYKPGPARADQTYAAKPAPGDFRGLTWGLPLEAATAQGLAPVTKPVALPATYFRPDEPLRLGLAEIRSVAYYFPKGRLTGVGIVFEGQNNYFLLKDHLIEKYGMGRQMGERYGWTWPSFFIDLRMRGNVGELRYSHEP